jgi:hypothetical protein
MTISSDELVRRNAAKARLVITAVVTEGRSPTYEILSCLDLGTMVSEDLCSEAGHSSGRLSEAS